MARSAVNLSPERVVRSKGARTTVLVALAAIAVVAAWSLLPLEEWLLDFTSWVRSFGPLGIVVLAVALLIGTLLMVPASILYLAAGLLYGIGLGLAVAFGTALVGAAGAFLLARTLLRGHVEARLERHPRLKALDHAIRDASVRVVLLLRLAPLVPGNMHNYAFGVSQIPLSRFLLAAAIGMAPWVLLFTALGAAGGAYLARAEMELGAWHWAMLGGSVVVLGLLAWLIARRAKAKLAEMGVSLNGEQRSSPKRSTAEPGTSRP